MDNADKAGDKREKSLTFGVQHRARGTKEPQSVELNGEQPPQRHEFRQLGIGVRMHPKRGTGPLLTKRVQEAQTALKKSRLPPLGFDMRVAIAAVMIIAAALYGVRLADISKKTAASLESTVMYALWGPAHHVGQRKLSLLFSCRDTTWRRPWSSGTGECAGWHGRRAQEARHKQSSTEVAPAPKATGPLDRALQEFHTLGWQPLVGWWQWKYPGAHAPINLALDSQLYVEHVFREALRRQKL